MVNHVLMVVSHNGWNVIVAMIPTGVWYRLNSDRAWTTDCLRWITTLVGYGHPNTFHKAFDEPHCSGIKTAPCLGPKEAARAGSPTFVCSRAANPRGALPRGEPQSFASNAPPMGLNGNHHEHQTFWSVRLNGCVEKWTMTDLQDFVRTYFANTIATCADSASNLRLRFVVQHKAKYLPIGQ